jgi:hypothetical protein
MNKLVYIDISLQLSKSYKFLIDLYKSLFSNKKINFNILKILIRNQARGKNIFKYIKYKKYLNNIFFSKKYIKQKNDFLYKKFVKHLLNKFYYICLRFEKLLIFRRKKRKRIIYGSNLNYFNLLLSINKEFKNFINFFKL